MQETFASVWRSAARYKPERGPGAPWLYGVARNAIVDRSRARNEPPAEAPDEPSLEAGPDERAEQAWVAVARAPRARDAARARARGGRARLLERPLAERGRRETWNPARDREDADARRARASRRGPRRGARMSAASTTGWTSRASHPPSASGSSGSTTLLVAAGPPAELPRGLERAARAGDRGFRSGAAEERSRSSPPPLLRAASFSGGFVVGDNHGMRVTQVVSFRGHRRTSSHRCVSARPTRSATTPMVLTVRACRSRARLLRALHDARRQARLSRAPASGCGATRRACSSRCRTSSARHQARVTEWSRQVCLARARRHALRLTRRDIETGGLEVDVALHAVHHFVVD